VDEPKKIKDVPKVTPKVEEQKTNNSLG